MMDLKLSLIFNGIILSHWNFAVETWKNLSSKSQFSEYNGSVSR